MTVPREWIEEVIEEENFIDWICEREGRFRFVVYQGMDAMENGIDELELSPRPYHFLRKAGYETINSLVNDIDRRKDILKIRGMNRRCVDEIMLRLFIYTYWNLRPEKRRAYLDMTRELNGQERG